ncbi:MAG: hypothetical protein K2H17_03460, partial [Duncaniella sp.]|uniref:hypothetical protein n=1 Tax=Duncaniella sp. TaxID=2518496 RepID=UPI0023BE8143
LQNPSPDRYQGQSDAVCFGCLMWGGGTKIAYVGDFDYFCKNLNWVCSGRWFAMAGATPCYDCQFFSGADAQITAFRRLQRKRPPVSPEILCQPD